MPNATSPLERQANAYLHGARQGADYLRSIASRAVIPTTQDLGALDLPLPVTGLPANEVLDLMDRLGRPGSVASAAGRYFGYVIGGALPAASGARVMLSAWDQIADALTGPSVVEMERVAIGWIVDLLGLPIETRGAFTSGATMANMALIVTARDTLLSRRGYDIAKGLVGAPPLRIVASAEIHATVLKTLRMAGLGTDRIEWVDVDGEGRLRPDRMPQLDETTLVLTQAGNVCTGSFDPFEEIADRCLAAGAWLHVDGAFGLWARTGTATGAALAGLEKADSWVVDAHKTLNTPYDSGLALCRHPERMRTSMAINAAYLPEATPCPADLAPEFSRSARGAETWAALLSLGRCGVTALVNRFHDHAKRIARELTALGFQVPHAVHFNQVFATLPGQESRCAEIVAKVQASGEAWFGPATWQGHKGFRISVSNWATTDADLDRLIAAVAKALAETANGSW